MSGTKLLIDITMSKLSKRAREMALGELVEMKSKRAMVYVACNTKFCDTARQALMCLYAMDAFRELKSISKKAKVKDIRIYAQTLINENEMNKECNIVEIE